MPKANETQVAGDHYKSEYQHWDFVHDIGLNYLEAQVVKYVTRWRSKNGVQDLEKALHFVAKLQEEKTKALEITLEEYQKSNGLDASEFCIVHAIISGSLRYAKEHLEAMILVNYSDVPDKHYTNQDPDLKDTYTWTCGKCGKKSGMVHKDEWQSVIAEHKKVCVPVPGSKG